MTARTILVVEDDPQLRLLIARSLKEHGLGVLTASTGAEMQVTLQNSKVDLVVLDIMLPGTNGIELLRRLRLDSDLPVIFISARGDEADRVIGLELGADDYLAKPFGTRELIARITALGSEPMQAMGPFVKPFDAFHAKTAPSNWLEGLVKAYVGDGLAADFYREVAAFLDADTRDLVIASLVDSGHADFVVDRVRHAIERDPRVAGPLALWGRRLMGEALSQAQRVVADRDSLAALLAGGVDRPGLDLAALGRMFTRLTENHAKRMAELGLAS